MKKIFPFLMALLLIASCGKDKEEKDLTTLIVGVYSLQGDEGRVITVNKIDNKTVSIAFVYDGESFSFTNVVLNSETTFTLNEHSIPRYSYVEVSGDYESCYFRNIYTGTGTVSANSISLFLTYTSSPAQSNPCPEDVIDYSHVSTETFTGLRL
jgi:hypothetical protein